MRSIILSSVRPVVPLVTGLAGQFIPAGNKAALKANEALSPEYIADLIYRATAERFLKLEPIYQDLGLVAIVFLVFLSIKSVTFFTDYLVILLAFMVFEILKASGFFYLALENRPKEVIVVK